MVIMSELGWGYFLESRQEKKILRDYDGVNQEASFHSYSHHGQYSFSHREHVAPQGLVRSEQLQQLD